MSRLEQNLRAVRARIAAAARAAGRDPATVALLAVSKTWPADDVRALAGLGQLDFGENRAQELLGKAPDLADLPVRWHFVGQLQRNKAAAVARLGAVAARGGALPADVPALADLVGDAAGLRLRGLMAVAPRGEDPRPAFDR